MKAAAGGLRGDSGGSAAETYAALADRISLECLEDPQVKALWLEASSREELRLPYRRLEIHLAADEPDFQAVLSRIERLLSSGGHSLQVLRRSDVPKFARQLEALVGGEPVTVVLEKTCYLAKRPRAAVKALLDKTGHLYHVMDFSLAK